MKGNIYMLHSQNRQRWRKIKQWRQVEYSTQLTERVSDNIKGCFNAFSRTNSVTLTEDNENSAVLLIRLSGDNSIQHQNGNETFMS